MITARYTAPAAIVLAITLAITLAIMLAHIRFGAMHYYEAPPR
jgi:hypothetical protein